MTAYGDKKSLVHTYKTHAFAGKVIEEKTTGKKILKLNAQKYYQNELNKFLPNTDVSIYITSQKPKRTEQQNRYLWGVFYPLIAEKTGEGDLDRLHTLFKGKFLTKGIVEVLGEKVRIVGSSTDLSVSEFCEFVLNIQDLTGVTAPPTENYLLEPLQPVDKSL